MRIVCIGDLHMPFHHRATLEKIVQFVAFKQPDIVVQVGDLYDQYGFSRFTKRYLIRPDAELRSARHFGSKLWQEVREASPKAECFQILGNHDVRAIKRAEERLPEAQELVRATMFELYRFEGVQTIEDDRQELVIDDIVFMHGYRGKLGDHMRYNRKRTVVGHSHVGGVVYEQFNNEIIWELNCGFVADETKEPLSYRPQKTSKWTLGVGFIEQIEGIYAPQFIPLR